MPPSPIPYQSPCMGSNFQVESDTTVFEVPFVDDDDDEVPSVTVAKEDGAIDLSSSSDENSSPPSAHNLQLQPLESQNCQCPSFSSAVAAVSNMEKGMDTLTEVLKGLIRRTMVAVDMLPQDCFDMEERTKIEALKTKVCQENSSEADKLKQARGQIQKGFSYGFYGMLPESNQVLEKRRCKSKIAVSVEEGEMKSAKPSPFHN